MAARAMVVRDAKATKLVVMAMVLAKMVPTLETVATAVGALVHAAWQSFRVWQSLKNPVLNETLRPYKVVRSLDVLIVLEYYSISIFVRLLFFCKGQGLARVQAIKGKQHVKCKSFETFATICLHRRDETIWLRVKTGRRYRTMYLFGNNCHPQPCAFVIRISSCIPTGSPAVNMSDKHMGTAPWFGKLRLE